ncbi:MAG TPA: uroporphyrinogen-III C-methyltransferase [Polyangia bacterium]|nr:uroporphyrinogen-III C-methyltransferase [Polyangia bacterium]
MAKGIVYLVGAGPGDPGLLTVRGAECLRRADVVVCDYLVSESLLEHAPAAAERIVIGKHGTGRTMSQEEVSALLVARAREGKLVVRLKGGDPFVFGRGGEEAEALAAEGVPWEVVPGVTAAVAVPAYAGIPLTHRDLAATVAFATGHERWDKEYSGIDWAALAQRTGTVVLFMSVRRLSVNLTALVEHGRDPKTPAALIEWGTLPRQRVVTGTLADLAARAEAAGLQPPAMLVVGDVVRLRERLRWFERRPLFGQRVLTLRARTQSLAGALYELGAEVLELFAIRVVPPESYAPLDEALVKLGSYDWVVFTSQNAVGAVFERLMTAGRDARAFGRARVCAIGGETAAALRAHGVIADLLPDDAVAEGLVAAFATEEVEGKRLLLPRAAEARETFPEALRLRGAHVDVVAAYRTVRASAAEAGPVLERLRKGELDIALFASGSQVTSFFELVGGGAAALLGRVLVGAIGPVTAEALRRRGVEPQVVPRRHTMGDLIEAILEHLKEKR